MSENNNQKFLSFLKRILKKSTPRFSIHYVIYTFLFLAVVFSVVQIVTATTPNPGHPWAQVGDGVFAVTNNQTAVRTYTFPDANATVLTTNALVTVAQGGTGIGTLASNGVLYGNGTGAIQALAVNAGATACLTQTSSAAPVWGACGSTYTFSTGLTNTSGTITANLSTGISGGQSVIGGTGSGENLTLSSTSNATKGKILFGTSGYDEVNNRLGIGTTSPKSSLHIDTTGYGLNLENKSAAGDSYILSNAYYGSGFITSSLQFKWDATHASFGSRGIGMSYLGGIVFYADNVATTADTLFTPTERMRILNNGNVSIGSTSAASMFNVGSSNQFQVNSTGAIAAATGITSSGTIAFSGLSTNGPVYTSGGTGTLTTTAPTSGAIGYWSRSSPTLTPTTANDIVSIPTTNTTGADLGITNTGVYTGTGIFNLTANSATSGNLASITGNGVTSGNLLSLSSSSAAATTGQSGINVALTGALTGAQTTYGGYYSNTRTGASAVNVGLYATASGAIGANYAAIFNGGNVGIGTTTPNSLLEVSNTSNAIATIHQTSTLSSSLLSQLILVNGPTYFGASDRSYELFNKGATSTTADFGIQYWDGTSYYNRFAILANGKVGIGTANPDHGLNVTTSMQVGTAFSYTGVDGDLVVGMPTANSRFLFGQDNNTAGGMVWVYNATTANAYLKISADMSGISTITNQITLLRNGNVGINTVTPSAQLVVTGSTKVLNSIMALYDTTPQAQNTGAGIVLGGVYTGTTTTEGAQIQAAKTNNTAGDYGFGLSFGTRQNGSSIQEKMRIDSSGNVGIGTTSPTAFLNIKAGTATANTAPLKFTSGTNLTTPEAGAMEFNGSRLYITDSTPTRQTLAYTSDLTSGYVPYTGATSNVVLGAYSLSSTTAIYAGAASGNAILYTTGADGGTFPFGIAGTTKGLRVITSSAATTIQGVDNTLAGSYQPLYLGGSSLQFQTNGTSPAMTIDSSQNVGIGTISPTNILSLGGTAPRTIWMERNTTAATAGQGLTISSGGAIAGTADLAGGDLTLKSGTATGVGSSAMHFFTSTAQGSTNTTDNAPTEKMTILGNGNVGIGTTSPTSPLHIAKSISDNPEVLIAGTVTSTSYGFGNRVDTNVTSSTQHTYGWYNNPTLTAPTGKNSANLGIQGTVVAATGVTNPFASQIDVGAITKSGTGTITNAVGIYLRDQTAGTNNYGVYQDGTNKNYFNGNVGIGVTSPTTNRLDIADTTLAGSGSLAGSILNLAQTWNTTGTPTAIKLNVTNTASTGTPLLMDLQVGGVSMFNVGTNGKVYDATLTASNVVFTDASKNLTSTGIGTSSQFIKGDGSLDSSTYLTTSSATSTYVPYTGGTSNVNLGVHNLTVDTSTLYVDSSGHRVGIGTTSTLLGDGTYSAPATFQTAGVGGNFLVMRKPDTTYFTQGIYMQDKANFAGWDFGVNATGSAIIGYGSGANETAAVGAARNSTILTITNGGLVGIGVATAGFPLDVQAAGGRVNIKSTTGTNTAITSYVNSGGSVYMGEENSAGNAIMSSNGLAYAGAIGTNSGQAIQLAPNLVPAMTLLSGGNVGIGTNAPDTNLDISNGSILNSTSTVNYYRNVTTYSYTSSTTGTMEITMPKSWSNTMMTMVIKGYDFSSAGDWEVHISGYNYITGTDWLNYKAQIMGSAPFSQVRLAYDTGTSKVVVLLGTTSTVWQYPKIEVTDFAAGYNNITGWGSGWTIAPIVSEANISSVVTPTIQTYLTTGGNFGIGTTAPLAQTEIYGNSQLTAALTDAGIRTGLLSITGGINGTAGEGGGIVFGNVNTHTANAVGFAAIKSLITNGAGNTVGDLAFSTRNATGDTALTERMRILANGNVSIGSTSAASMFNVGSSNQFQVNSTGAITAATGITSSGTIAFSGLSSNGPVYTSGGTGTLTTTAPTSGAIGYWSRSSPTLTPTTANDIVSIPTTNTTGADLGMTNTGVYTGTGIFNLTANSATSGNLASITGNGVTSGNLLSLSSSSAAATTGQSGINVALTGALTGAQTTYGGYYSNTRTGATAVNVGLYATASGATGANYAAIFNAGNVGIGTTTPGYPLDVTGNARVTGNLYLASSGSYIQSDGNSIYLIPNTNTYFQVGATIKMNLNTYGLAIGNGSTVLTSGTALAVMGGNVGIGVASPSYNLHVASSTASVWTTGILNSNSTAGYGLVVQAGNDNTNKIAELRNYAGTAYFTALGNGNIGIGKTAPAYTLDVLDTTGTTGANTVVANFLVSTTNNGGSTILRVGAVSHNTDIEQNDSGNGPLRYGTYADTNIVNDSQSATALGNINFVTGNSGTGSSVAMTIGGGSQKGLVGIGLISPTALLHLAGGTATAHTAPLKFTAGTNLATPEDGAVEYNGTHYYATIGSTRYQLDQQGGGGLTVGTSTITSGTGGRVLYDNAGVLGEMTTTGSGTVLALATSPSFVTSVIGGASFDAFNTVSTTLNIGGAATTFALGGTPTTSLTANIFTNATAAAATKTINFGTGGVASSTTNINIGSVNGGTTAITSPTVQLSALTSNGPVYTSGGTGTLTTTAPTSGAIGYWSRSSPTLTPTTANDIVSIPTTNTTGADLGMTNTGVYTGTGIFNLTANSATSGNLASITGNGVTSGNLLSLSSSSAAATTGQSGINVALTGALTGAQTTYGGYYSNTRTGASAVNVGLYATASGATGANYAAIFNAGNVGFGTSTPQQKLDIVGNIQMTRTVDSTSGIIYKGGYTFIHDFVLPGTSGYNTFMGQSSGNFTMTGATGNQASYLTAFGTGTLTNNTTGSSNTAFGSFNLQSNTTGSYNTAIGTSALQYNTIGTQNTAIGNNALQTNIAGYGNVALGNGTLAALGPLTTAGSFIHGFEYQIVSIGTTNFTLIGASSNTVGVTFNATGAGTGTGTAYNIEGNNNVAIGSYSQRVTLGGNNIGIGSNTLYYNTTGEQNTAIGLNAMAANTTGGAQTAIGDQSLNAQTTGNNNTAIGYASLWTDTTSSNTTAIGYYALFDQNITANNGTGYNTAIGANTGRGIVTGTGNTILGANVTGLAAGLTNNIIIADGTGNKRISVTGTGALNLNAYGSGTNTGTFAYNLAVDASGNVIETAVGGTTRLDQITAATNTATINNTTNAIQWNWDTLTTQTGFTLGGGTNAGLTTGGILSIGNANYNYTHTVAETGSLANLTIVDKSTISTGTSVSNGLNINSTINATTGAGTRQINGINIGAPTLTACSAGTCAWSGVKVTTPAALTNVTSTGISVVAGGVPGSDMVNISNAGQGVTTAGVNAFSINYTGGAAAVESSAERIDFTGGTTAAGTWSGSRIVQGTITPGTTVSNIKLETAALAQSVAGTTNINGLNLGVAGAISNVTAAGTINFAGVNLITPAATAGIASSVILNDGIKISTGTATMTAGTSLTSNGIDLTVGALTPSVAGGTTNGISIVGGAINTFTAAGTTNGETMTTAALSSTVATTQTIRGWNLSSAGALSQATNAGTINWTGSSITMPNITQSTGTILAQGIYVKPGTITTGGTQVAYNADLSAASTVGTTTALKIPWLSASTSKVPISIDFGGFTAPNNGVDGIIKLARTSSSSATCATATAQGLVFINDAGTQIGHFCTDSAGTLKYYGAAVTTGTDVAENYSDPTNQLEPGDVVVLDKNSTYKNAITMTSTKYDQTLLGIISTDPGVALSGIEETNGSTDLIHPKLVALVGRVPTKVSSENGPIQIGDYVTSSSIPGVAMKATKPGITVGIALENYSDSGVGSIEVFAKLGYYNGESLTNTLTGLDTTSPTFDKSALVQLLVNNRTANTDVSALSTDKLIAGLEIITPTVVSDNVETNAISPSTGTDIGLLLGPDGKFIIGSKTTTTDANGTPTTSAQNPVMTVDALGNATFAGTVTAKQINVSDVAGIQAIAEQINSLAQGQEAFTLTASAMNTLSGAVTVLQADVSKLKTDQDTTNTTVQGLVASGTDLDTRLKAVEALLSANAFNSLTSVNTSALTVTGGATFGGDTTFNGATTFNSQPEFTVPPLFNKDTAGFALVHQGDRRVRVVFSSAYMATPVVNTSMAFDTSDNMTDAQVATLFASNTNFVVVDKDQTGFTILLNKPATRDIKFSWLALSVKDPQVYESVIEGLTIDPPVINSDTTTTTPQTPTTTPTSTTTTPTTTPTTTSSTDTSSTTTTTPPAPTTTTPPITTPTPPSTNTTTPSTTNSNSSTTTTPPAPTTTTTTPTTSTTPSTPPTSPSTTPTTSTPPPTTSSSTPTPTTPPATTPSQTQPASTTNSSTQTTTS